MFGIENIIGFIANLMLDIRDANENSRVPHINANTITLYCIVSEDLPVDVRNAYCKSLEVVYAVMIRSLLSLRDRSRIDATPRDIFRSLPVLTPYDRVKFDKDVKTFKTVTDWFFNRKYNGNDALDAFTEAYINKIDEYYTSMESDAILKESRGAVPTYVEVSTNVMQFNGRATEKRFSIGIEVRPKVVSNVEMVSMIMKRVVPEEPKTKSFLQRMKALFSFNYKRKEVSEMDTATKKSLDTMMATVANIKKPFVCMLLSNTTRDMLLDKKINITNNSVIQKLYSSMPVMSLSIYDANTDTITASLTRDAYFITRTAGEFNSEISNYERQLSEMVRVNKVFG